jgi:hypothetical protein
MCASDQGALAGDADEEGGSWAGAGFASRQVICKILRHCQTQVDAIKHQTHGASLQTADDISDADRPPAVLRSKRLQEKASGKLAVRKMYGIGHALPL